MTTLAKAGRISESEVTEERERLTNAWCSEPDAADLDSVTSREKAQNLDLFDQVQLSAVISICREYRTLSDAGRKLFSVSRLSKNSNNAADRLRKFRARFGLSWNDVSAASPP